MSINAKIKQIAFGRIVADRTLNVRIETAYSKDELKTLMADIMENGLKEPITVVESKDGTLKVCRGYRRHAAISEIRLNNAQMFQEIPCIVYPSETPDSEVALLTCDHNSVKGLNDFERYLSVKRLLGAGLSEEKIAARMEKSRGWVQEKKMLAMLPEDIEAEFLKRQKGEPAVNITAKDVRALYTLWIEDGRTMGPKYTEAKDKLFAGTSPVKKTVPARSAKELVEMASILKNSFLSDMLKWASGDTTINPVDVQTRLDDTLKTAKETAAK